MLSEIKYENHRVLVTGAAGFIGSNLVEWLLKNGNQVVGLDNFATGKKENVNSFLSHPNYTFLEGDIRDFTICEKACDGVEHVLHQAAIGSVPRSIKNPRVSTDVNIGGFVNMAFAATNAGVKRFVYASSSSIYGDSPVLPKVEAQIGKPLSPYAITKNVNEMFANNFFDLYNLEVIGLRYFNVFGRRQDPFGVYAAVIPIFVRQILNGEAVTINGDGMHARDFTYIDNVIEINIRGLLADNEKAIGQAYNVGFGGKTTLNELYDILRNLLTPYNEEIAKLQPVYGPDRPGDIKESLASIDKARQLLGYNPEYDIKSGLEKAIDWYVGYFRALEKK